MNATWVHVWVKPEFVDAFIEATRTNHQASVQEFGNFRFDVLRNPENPCHFMLYEVYEHADQASAHKQTTHYLQWREQVAPMMANPREGKPLQLLFPESR
ncbi:MAG: antibiotic biosynthesis monooxygenase [Cytophagaceae bacterium]|jgi:autoinducer 2-degrading protein|nr:antibiotic biosynthesis monooxygenase [Cytophagaceae bacterium]